MTRPPSCIASLFGQLGIPDVIGLRPITREEANDPALAALLDNTTGIFMTGGNQLRLSSVIGGTALGRAIIERHRHGTIIAGTSAGASAISSHMVAFGTSGTSPKQRMTQMSAGLGLLPGVVIDQHFEQRNRIGRLLALIAQSPALIGMGVDEDTAALVSPSGVMEVLGKGSVTILDPARIETDAYEVKRHRADHGQRRRPALPAERLPLRPAPPPAPHPTPIGRAHGARADAAGRGRRQGAPAYPARGG